MSAGDLITASPEAVGWSWKDHIEVHLFLRSISEKFCLYVVFFPNSFVAFKFLLDFDISY